MGLGEWEGCEGVGSGAWRGWEDNEGVKNGAWRVGRL